MFLTKNPKLYLGTGWVGLGGRLVDVVVVLRPK